MKMLKRVKSMFFREPIADDPFVWKLAEGLMWRDEDGSIGAMPVPIKEQPDAARYYADALYLINFVKDVTT